MKMSKTSIRYCLFTSLCALLLASATSAQLVQKDYTFDGSISRHVLENYLARSCTATLILELVLDDDLRMIKNTGAKFVGRAIGMWGSEEKLESLIATGGPFAKRIHEADPEIILQGAIFEIITKGVNSHPIPESIFQEFGLKPEKRNFRYEDMLYADGHRVNQWRSGSSVPDMSRIETRMWFVYVAKCYIGIGVEAIHFGQVALMDDNDPEHTYWLDMMGHVRAYAHNHARRHFVLCDAHVPSGGIVHDGKLMFDMHSFPCRPRGVKGKPYEAILEVGFTDAIYGRSAGGITPSGWKCEALPYIVEIDNFGNSDHVGQYREDEKYYIWGWDEINWFAHQPESYRNAWLKYAWDWVRENDPNGYFQMPLRRYGSYLASMTPPEGQRQEETIKAIWAGDGNTAPGKTQGNTPIQISLIDKAGKTIATTSSDSSATLSVDRRYAPGDQIRITGPTYLVVQADESIPPSLLFAPAGTIAFPLPSGPEQKAYPPILGQSSHHIIRAHAAKPEDLKTVRNLAVNSADVRGESKVFPHASSNSECRNEMVFAARNAIDGDGRTQSHGAWPHQSWGPDKRTDLWWQVDFGRPVRAGKVVLTIRADFPHDSYWYSATIKFSDGSSLPIQIQKTREKQEFSFTERDIEWVRFTHLKQEEPMGWCGFSEVEVWGYESGRS